MVLVCLFVCCTDIDWWAHGACLFVCLLHRYRQSDELMVLVCLFVCCTDIDSLTSSSSSSPADRYVHLGTSLSTLPALCFSGLWQLASDDNIVSGLYCYLQSVHPMKSLYPLLWQNYSMLSMSWVQKKVTGGLNRGGGSRVEGLSLIHISEPTRRA